MHAPRVCIIPEARCRDHRSHFYGMTNCGQKWTIRTQRRKTLKKLLTKHQRAHLLFSRRRCNAEWSRGGSHASRNELFFVGGSTYKLTVRVLHTHSVSCHTHDTEHEAIAHSIYDNHDYRYQPHKPRPCTAVAREAAARVLVARVLAKATICERVALWRSSDANSGGASAARPRGCWRRRR